MGLVIDYWLSEISRSLEPAKSALNQSQERLNESKLLEYTEAGMNFQYQEGETVEYEGDLYKIDERNLFQSFLGKPNDLRYTISGGQTNSTITVSEDEII